MSNTQLNKIKNLLEQMHEIANSPDWSESHAQEIMQSGGELYEEIWFSAVFDENGIPPVPR